MSRRTVALALTAVFLALLALSTLSANAVNGPVEINLGRNCIPDPIEPCLYVAEVGQPVVLCSQWGACSPGLVRAYMNWNQTEVTLDEEPLLSNEQIDELWGPIVAGEPEEACPDSKTLYWASWCHELPFPLGAGEHVFYATYSVDHPFIDGGDWDGDGRPDTWADLFYQTENHLLVTDP